MITIEEIPAYIDSYVARLRQYTKDLQNLESKIDAVKSLTASCLSNRAKKGIDYYLEQLGNRIEAVGDLQVGIECELVQVVNYLTIWSK